MYLNENERKCQMKQIKRGNKFKSAKKKKIVSWVRVVGETFYLFSCEE